MTDDGATRDAEAIEDAAASATGPDDAAAVSTDGGAGDATVAVPAGTEEPSLTDLAQQPIVKAWTTFVAAVAGLIGAGIGIAMILGDALDESMFEFGGSSGVPGVAVTGLPPNDAIFWAIPIAAILGVYVGLSLPTDEKTTVLVAGISSFAGAAVLLVVSAFLTTIAVDDLSLDFGGLLVTALAAGLVVGAVAAGGVWLARNQAPDGLSTTSGR